MYSIWRMIKKRKTKNGFYVSLRCCSEQMAISALALGYVANYVFSIDPRLDST